MHLFATYAGGKTCQVSKTRQVYAVRIFKTRIWNHTS